MSSIPFVQNRSKQICKKQNPAIMAGLNLSRFVVNLCGLNNSFNDN
jgi:hypothetical protein